MKVSVANNLVFDAIKGVVSAMKNECEAYNAIVECVIIKEQKEDEESIKIGDELTRIWHAKNPTDGEFFGCHKDSNPKETETSFAQEAYFVLWSKLVKKIKNGTTQ